MNFAVMATATAVSATLGLALMLSSGGSFLDSLWLPAIALAALVTGLSLYWLISRSRKQGGIFLLINTLILSYLLTPFLLA